MAAATTSVVEGLAAQFGPRLLRNFIRDRGSQVVLGTFISTFVYCLLVLRTVNGVGDKDFVPEVGVTMGVGLALASLAVLIYFIHHVAVSIQVTSIIERVGNELLDRMRELYPGQLGKAVPAEELPAPLSEGGTVVTDSGGYVLGVEQDSVFGTAKEKDLVVRLVARPGQFVVAGDPLLEVWPPSKLDDPTRKELRGGIILGSERTTFQNIGFAAEQLTEIAVRALSPGVNDPFTAISCIDRLGDAFAFLAGREFPSPYRRDDDGRLRVIAEREQFPELLASAFGPIRQYGRDAAPVLVRLLVALAAVAARTRQREDREAVTREADAVRRAAASVPDEADRERVHAQFAELQRIGGGA